MLNRITKIVFILIAIFWSVHTFANVAFYHYGIQNGLPEGKIISINQDSTGFIWMAGENSLYRYDGNQFKIYRSSNTHLTVLPFRDITTLFSDSKGTLWIGSRHGIAFYDFHHDHFISEVEGWNHERVNDFAGDKEGFLWVATEEGLARFNPETKITTWFTDSATVKTTGNNILPEGNITHIACQDDGKIWFATSQGDLYRFDPQNRIMDNFSLVGKTNFRLAQISNLEFKNNLLYVSTLSKGFFWLNPDVQFFENEVFHPFGYTIHHFRLSGDSAVWLAGDNGLIRFNFKSFEHERFTEEADNPLSLNRTAVNHVFTDKQNNLWISSGIRGVNFGLANVPFKHFTVGSEGAYQLTQPEITAIQFDSDGNMWLGYEGGFVERHGYDPLSKKQFQLKARNQTGEPGAVFALLHDSNYQLWLGGWQSGLQKLNKAGTAFEFAPVLPDTLNRLLADADIRGLAEDQHGNIWISFHGIGIGRYHPAAHLMTLFRHNPEMPLGSLSNDFTYDLCFDKENNLWIATANGISRFNPDSEQFKNFFHEAGNPLSLNNSTVNTVYCDHAGMIWAGTSLGLNVYIPRLNTFQPVAERQDFTFQNISAIQSTIPGEIWVSTLSGIFRLTYSRDSNQEGLLVNSQFFTRYNGLLSTNYFPRSAASHENIIFFGGNEGIDYFNPGNVERAENKTPVKPLLTELAIDGQNIFIGPFASGDGTEVLKLNHRHSFISIRFTALRFNHSGRQKFRYKLDGLNNEWIYPQNEQVATYSHLPPGKYTFRVETEDRSGNWSTNQASLSLVVHPPFWQTIPFIIFVLLVFTVLIPLFLYTKSRIMILKQKELESLIEVRTSELLAKNNELEKSVQTKNKLFSIVSHDLRSPFSGVLGILELLADSGTEIEPERQKELLQLAKNSAADTYELLDNLLTWAYSQMQKTVCTPQKHNISHLLKKNIGLRKPSAQQKEISLEYQFPEILEANFDRDMINTVIRNILNNAVKFSYPGSKIEISAFRQKGEVMVRIADYGIGIDPNDTQKLFYNGKTSRHGTKGERGTGLGLIICREFVEKNGGKIWAAPNQPQGSVFQFTLPAA